MAENSTELADELHRTGSVTCCELGMSQLSENQLIDLRVYTQCFIKKIHVLNCP